MATVSTEAISIDPEALVLAYERARWLNESGDRAWRVTPGQRVDLHRLVTDLRSPGGLAEHGVGPDVWIDYLAPILTENGSARRLLKEVLLNFATATNSTPPPPPPPPEPQPVSQLGSAPLPPSTFWSRIRALVAKRHWSTVLASAMIVVAIMVGVGLSHWTKQAPRPVTSEGEVDFGALNPPTDSSTATSPAQTSALEARAGSAYDQAMTVTRQFLSDRPKAAITPRSLAAAHAGANPRLGSPDVLLANMLHGWSIPPDEALTADARGIVNLRRLTAEIAAISAGLPRVLFEPRIAAGDKSLEPGMLAGRSEVQAYGAPSWSKAWLFLLLAPLFLFVLYAVFDVRRRSDELLEDWIETEARFLGGPQAPQGIKQSSSPFSIRASEPLITRESLRALMRYRPEPGRRLDARRSVRAVIRNVGYAEPIMRPVQRAVDYLIIIQRWQPNDHERLRVRQFMEAMSRRGLSLSVYDYERDPLLVRRVIAADDHGDTSGLNGREELVALPALRDLHPSARLILVTDGRDIVDRVTGRVRENVARGFAFWKERTLLTPVPVGDWGEIEFALSRDLELPLGRTTEDMAADLVRGFQRTAGRARFRIALDRAHGITGMAKLDAWWSAIAAGFGAGAKAGFGNQLLPEKTLLVTDLVPSREIVAEIIDDLKRWLGAKGFLWHAGCAIYPQLRFDLTLHIGVHLRAGSHPEAPFIFRGTSADRRILERITILPWFRTGRMPEWLRREVLICISRDELDRAGQVIRSLFAAEKQEKPGPLAIWWPRAGSLSVPPDAVMASALAGDVKFEAPLGTPEREQVLRGAARRAVMRRHAGTAFLIACACAACAWLVPDFNKSPHPSGAWYPLFAFVAVSLTTTFVCIGLRRLFPFAPKPPGPALPFIVEPPQQQTTGSRNVGDPPRSPATPKEPLADEKAGMTPVATATESKPQRLAAVILATSMGNMLTWYDFYLYGSLAPIIGVQFFASYSSGTRDVFALLAFAAGFLLRPFGAVLFGLVGDLVGRKYALVVTSLIMGVSTLIVGLLPNAATIGITAPIILITVRLMQGLALGGEYGGAAIYVAEHAPVGRRGYYTSFIQTTPTLGLIVALLVIQFTRNALGEADFAAWGWRIPFLLSGMLIGASVWLRVMLKESPVFQKLKDAREKSEAPLREAFGNWSNAKFVILALIGGTLGQGVVWYAGQFYALFFLQSIIKVDSYTANLLMTWSIVLGTGFFIVFGAWSDKIGRKPIILAGCAIAALTLHPLFRIITASANPALEKAIQAAKVQVVADPEGCGDLFNPVGTRVFTAPCDTARAYLSQQSIKYDINYVPGSSVKIVVNGKEVPYTTAAVSNPQVLGALQAEGYPKPGDPGIVKMAHPFDIFRPQVAAVIGLLFILIVYVTMVFGPIAAMLVELFPTKIRYTSMSLPYHIGNGWFGGLLPATAFAIVASTGDIYAGLWYPTFFASLTFIVGLLFLPETKDIGPLDDVRESKFPNTESNLKGPPA